MNTGLFSSWSRRRSGAVMTGFAAAASIVALSAFAICLLGDDEPARGSTQSENTEESEATGRTISVEKLDSFNGVVGEWRGVGQPQRGSRRGSWIEAMECRWVFDDDGTAVVFDSDENPDYAMVRFRWDTERQLIAAAFLTIAPDDDASESDPKPELFGMWSEENPDEFVAVSDFVEGTGQTRMTLRQLSEKRCTILLEERRTESGSFRRIAGIGYTRKGESLAVAGAGGPVCVVTGGRGTMRVEFEGRDYFVCCSGCLQVFEADPAGTIADYQARRKEAQEKR